jgi:hypothetical protein
LLGRTKKMISDLKTITERLVTHHAHKRKVSCARFGG